MINHCWRRGAVLFIDVSTPKFPRAVARIDADDIRLIMGSGRWCAWSVKPGATVYAARSRGGRKNRTFQYMHRAVLRLTDRRILADHRDGCGLNNRRRNLREATRQQNNQHSSAHPNTSSRWKGVAWDSYRLMWAAKIGHDRKQTHLGRFSSERAAARAYDKAALRYHGKFAKLNFPRGSK